ncbi:MAG TPA: hydrogenase maturation protease [Longimicrobium sp.]|nr:hydrogenase maturation protease [Longimicrobium sp.]
MPVAIVGLGNVLMGDDGLGPHVLRALESAYTFDDGVALLDLGTPGLDLIPHLMDADAAIVVDTVKSAGVPGELRLYGREQIVGRNLAPRVTPHAPGLQETLLTLDLLGRGPRDVVLVGVVPGPVDLGLGLSPGVEAAVPVAMAAVLAELARLGHSATARAVPVPSDAWWANPGEHFVIPVAGAKGGPAH